MVSVSNSVRLADFLPRSRANGPGIRSVVWVQGCPRRCEGCCNPSLLDFDGPHRTVSPADLAGMVIDVRGVTLSGGEPLHPANAGGLCEFLDLLPRDLDRMAFTGYTEEELADPAFSDVLSRLDLAICGPYEAARDTGRGILASGNQTILRLTDAFNETDEELKNSRRVLDLVLSAAGEVIVTGLFSPPKEMTKHVPTEAKPEERRAGEGRDQGEE